MNNNDIIKEWLRFSETDLAAAQHLYNNMYPKPLEIICYHCEQSAEKALKGFLIYNGLESPRTHDLPLLCDKCVELNSGLEKIYDACEFLTIYGVQPRYPYQLDISVIDTEHALEYAKYIYVHILELINLV